MLQGQFRQDTNLFFPLKPVCMCSVKGDFAACSSARVNLHLGLEVTSAPSTTSATPITTTTTPEASTAASCTQSTHVRHEQPSAVYPPQSCLIIRQPPHCYSYPGKLTRTLHKLIKNSSVQQYSYSRHCDCTMTASAVSRQREVENSSKKDVECWVSPKG